MMESCLASQPDRVGPVEVDDIRRDLLSDFSDLPVQDSTESQAENLQVYLRVRPFTAAESSSGESQDCVTLESPDTVVLKAPRSSQSNKQSDKPLPQTAQKFTFTQVFGPEAGQRKVFEGSVRGSVRDVLEGGNCLVFTYGVTNAGKTFTFLGPEHDSGLLPRSLAVIFNSIEGRLYSRCDLKPQRCRDFSRLTPDQQTAESSSKKNLLRLLKESDRSVTSGRSAFLDGSLGSDSSVNSISEADSFCLDVDSNVRFSIWVSFCEIYNDNIHDLLEQVPSGHHRRTVLRLSQDVKGNSFIKDLRWVQVNSSEEAYRVMKIGKKNQSFSSTRLNQLSSRSHSIFSIRILRVDDVGVPRVLGISELALCDLAGSERCSRTHNTGERLKEAGNINSSLLALGKCINAMRLNQNAKFQHHVPFRESKLTHFLQFFFCGAGRVSMVVNINQSPSCFDETLNVLKFSALAQKVVVLNSRPPVPDDAPHKSAMELSMIIDEADRRRNVSGRGRKSSLVAWETNLEDVLEGEDGEEWDEEEGEDSVMEGTVLEAGGEEDEEEEEERTMEEEPKADGEAALRLLLEAQIREEVSSEFMELFNTMEKDYSERLEKEREILEERAEKRVEILKNLRAELTCRCLRRTGGEEEEEEERRKRQCDDKEEEKGGPAKKRVVLEEEIWRLHMENDKKEETIVQLRERVEMREEELRRQEEEVEKERTRLEEEKERTKLEEELRSRQEEVEELKKEQVLLEQKVQKLTADLDECPGCASLFVSLQSDQKETCRLTKENKALVNGIFQLQTEVTGLQKQLRERTDRTDSLSEQLNTSKTRVQDLESQSEEKANIIKSLTQEVEHLRQEVKEGEGRSSGGVFHATMEQLKKESQAALERSAQKSHQMEELQREKIQLEETLTHSENTCHRLRQELANQKAEFSRQLQSLRAELESEGGALRGRLEEKERQELHGLLSEKQNLLEESLRQMEIVRRELERLKENLQTKEEEEDNLQTKEEENLQTKEEEENLQTKEEEENLQTKEEEEENLQTKEEEENLQTEEEENLQTKEEENLRRSREFEAVKREMERLQRLKEERETQTQSMLRSGGRVQQTVPASPLRSNMADRKKTPKTCGRKRKSCEVQDLVFSENKRNRLRGNTRNNKQEQKDGTLQKIGELIHSSPSILSSKAKTIIGLVSGHPVEKETVTAATKPRRGRRKLYKTGVSSPLLDSPHQMSAAAEEKESDHLIIKRQLRSKTCRK
ncbi:kinesin-like protein KIF20A [Thunnus albacares]|uniref:kinesin-like protein KIF20A n=2 Tax=Thunnus TaxID=8234 RepID=UPI001CF67B44|nr:kinesin-like protein KIF20A [Thunnus albacares]